MSEYQYSIKDLENFTQIKSHTIRIWEQRYGLLTPSRTSTNIRYYGENELKKILNIKLLYANGYKISRIAEMSEEEIVFNSKALILKTNNDVDGKVNDIILLIIDFNRFALEDFLNQELESRNITDLYLELILPLLKKMGELWQVNAIEIIHEHFFSYLFREKVLNKINSLPDPSRNASKVILFLHDNEEHEFSALMYYYLLKNRGYNCYYFGQKVPVREVLKAQEKLNPTYIITTFTSKLSEKNFDCILDLLKAMSRSSNVIISGGQLMKMNFKLPSKINYIKSVEEFNQLIEGQN